MRKIVHLLIALTTLAGICAFTALASGDTDEEAAPLFGIRIPSGYRDWRLISVAHERQPQQSARHSGQRCGD